VHHSSCSSILYRKDLDLTFVYIYIYLPVFCIVSFNPCDSAQSLPPHGRLVVIKLVGQYQYRWRIGNRVMKKATYATNEAHLRAGFHTWFQPEKRAIIKLEVA
jgi:hypothetical protein